MPELIRPSTVLPANRTLITIKTGDGLNLIGEVATPLGEVSGSLLMLHPNPSGGGMMDSHIYKKAANRLPAMAGIQIIRFNSRGSASQAGKSEGAYDHGKGEKQDVLAALEYCFERLKIKLEEGLKMIQVREKKLPYRDVKKVAQKILDLARPHQAKVLINENEKLALDIGADGVHYPSHSLIQLKDRPEFSICGASCHNLEELMIAQDLEMSFAVLSPVQKTESHPLADPIGWEIFSEYANKLDMPIFALGGLNQESLTTSWQCGGHGVAMQRSIWE